MLGDLNKLKVVDLKLELSNRGLETKGVKAVLIDRLRAALEEEGVTEEFPTKSSQEDSSDDVPATPSRRGRRGNSAREPTPPPEEADDTSSPVLTKDDVSNEPSDSSVQHVEEPEVVHKIEEATEPAPVTNDKNNLPDESKEEIKPEILEEPQECKPETPEESEENKPAASGEEEESKSSPSCEPEGDAVHDIPPSEDSEGCADGGNSGSEHVEDRIEPALEPQDECHEEEPEMQAEIKKEIEMQCPEEDDFEIKSEPVDTEQNDTSADGTPVKDEPHQQEGPKRVRKSRFTDNEDIMQVKEEPMETDVKPNDIKQETNESTPVKSESHHSRKRRRSSRSRSPPTRKSLEDEPEFDETAVILSWYDSDLNLVIDKGDFLSASPMFHQGFGYIWAGSRASYGYSKGRVCFEAKCLELCDVSHLENEPNPHVLRVGWSIQQTSMQLGEEPFSYGYGGTGKSSVNCQFTDYGIPFTAGDTVTAYLDMDNKPAIISFAVNGVPQGVAYEISLPEPESALFPHVLSKNIKFSVKFSGEPTFPLLEGYTLCGDVPLEDRVAGPRRPEKKEDCEMIMMCGLPGAGKTYWATKYASENLDKMYNVLGTNNLIDKMKVMGLPRKRNYSGRWDVLIESCTRCLNKLLERAASLRRNYILDQTNVYPSAQRRKMKHFEGFKRRAVVIVPNDEEFQRRVAKRHAEEGVDVPDSAVLEMKANFKLPEVGDVFSEVTYIELQESAARAMVEKYNQESREKGYMPQQPAKRPRMDRPNSSGDRRSDDRRDTRDHRDRREYRDHRDGRDSRDRGDRGGGYRPRGGMMDRSRGWGQHRGGWRDNMRYDNFRPGRVGDSRGSWRGGGGRGGGYDRPRGGGFSSGRGGGYGHRAGSGGGGKSWGHGGGHHSNYSGWGNQNQQSDYHSQQQWQGQGQGGYSSNSGWKSYGQSQQQQAQNYGQQSGYNTQSGYSAYGNNSNSSYNWNQQYYQFGGWNQQQTGVSGGTTAATGAVAGAVTGATSSVPGYETYQQWPGYNNQSYGYSTSSGTGVASTTGVTSGSHGTSK